MDVFLYSSDIKCEICQHKLSYKVRKTLHAIASCLNLRLRSAIIHFELIVINSKYSQ